MKKILIFFAVLCGSGAWGGGSKCELKYVGDWALTDSDEYLYVTTSSYNGPDTDGTGRALICGDGCSDGTEVCVSGYHVHKGGTKNGIYFYKCSDSMGEAWNEFDVSDLPRCTSITGMKRIMTAEGGDGIYVPKNPSGTYSGSSYYVSDKFCFFPDNELGVKPAEKKGLCTEAEKKTYTFKPVPCEQAGISHGEVCGVNCNSTGSETKYVTKCKEGYRPEGRLVGDGSLRWNGRYAKCVKIDKEGKQPGGGSSGTGSPNKCQTAACRSSEKCMACCELPYTETIWEPRNETCLCVKGGTFTKVDDKWICKVDSSLPVVTSKCDETLLARVREWQTQCAGNADALAEIKEVLTFCDSKSANNDAFLRLYDDLKQTVDTLCVEKDVQSQDDDIEMLIQVSKNRITTAQERLDGIQSGFKVSVWKDADGGFNTSRLVSDSVAGVVLGTAGGLITSSVVKKNQIKGGFEDIQCTVGGQVVAGWGDEFRVGIQ